MRDVPARPVGTETNDIRLRELVRERSGTVSEEWMRWLLSRSGTRGGMSRQLLRSFVDALVDLTIAGLGPHRDDVEPLWREAANLYGSVGAMRGLAAGEIIEEVQFLRESLIRHLFNGGARLRGSRAVLREALQLNRWIDRGVTEASVGHTDALFFALFRGDGVPEALTEELAGEVRDQLAEILAELADVAPERTH